MSKQIVQNFIQAALQQLQKTELAALENLPSYQVTATQDKKHGDFASNIALVLAKPLKRSPQSIASLLQQAQALPPQIQRVEIAGPGFLNFYLTENTLFSVIETIVQQGKAFGICNYGQEKKILIEFVSANPTGPLHVGHGRHAAYGAVVANLLAAIGYEVSREYYVNDAGRQMDILAVSTWLRYLEICQATSFVFPSNAYKGSYVIDMAQQLYRLYQQDFFIDLKVLFAELPLDGPQGGDKEIYIDAMVAKAKELLGLERYQLVFDLSLKLMLADIENDLAEFGVTYQNWFSERQFVQSGAVEKNVQALQANQTLYERDGALWFRSTDYGDEKDRVMQRSNGQRTYFANDFAYHINKFERGFSKAIDIFGADHHGYVPRMQAGLAARGITPPDKLTYLLVQFVTLYRQGQQVQMSTRSGSFVTLRELRQEIGNDAARFFYVMRKCEQHMDFDLDLAKSQSNDNPVYYIQYAYARICSVFRQAQEKKMTFSEEQGLSQLTLLKEPQELQLMTLLGRYPDIILDAALQHAPHLLTHYLRELAAEFHAYYNVHPFLVTDQALCHARLILIAATRQVLANGLELLGVSTPETM